MNSLERVIASVKMQEPDRVPVIPQLFGYTAALQNVSLTEYLQHGDLLAACQLNALETFHYDNVFALMDVSVETEAAGSKLIYKKGLYPEIGEYIIKDERDIGKLKLPDPAADGRMPELLKAAKILRQSVGDEVLVTGCVLGPLTLATQLIGTEKALYLAIDKPAQFEELLDFATEVIIQFGVAQLEYGVHLPLVFDPSASNEVVPESFFREYELQRLKKIFDVFKQHGSIGSWLHITGHIKDIFPYYGEIGVDIANIDYCVDPEIAMKALPGICISGNIKPVDFMDENPGYINEASYKLLQIFKDRGGFILSSGCEIPLEANSENIFAMVEASIK